MTRESRTRAVAVLGAAALFVAGFGLGREYATRQADRLATVEVRIRASGVNGGPETERVQVFRPGDGFGDSRGGFDYRVFVVAAGTKRAVADGTWLRVERRTE